MSSSRRSRQGSDQGGEEVAAGSGRVSRAQEKSGRAARPPQEAHIPRLAETLLASLKEHGAREIFGIPGDFVLPFYKVIEDSGILPHFTLSHEPAIGFAADAAARYHLGLGVAVATYGAGALNLVNAVACAY